MTPTPRLRAVPRASDGAPLTLLRPVPRTSASAPLGAGGSEVLRLITVQRVPVCLTVHANGRRRYGYWQSAAAGSGFGGSYVALPTDECDALHEAGRLVLGDPVIDPSKTTYPVRPAARPAVRSVVRAPVPAATAVGVPRRAALTA
ncbi:cell envelope biogenesis protein OmpA [Streptomyces sp. NPDC057620]|uniref:cell envelope biogenesis protein OmpA n=1 Tax=Streptomyces sp. NPDC057620 TaxID=3346185 RepID=UPI003694F5C1